MPKVAGVQLRILNAVELVFEVRIDQAVGEAAVVCPKIQDGCPAPPRIFAATPQIVLEQHRGEASILPAPPDLITNVRSLHPPAVLPRQPDGETHKLVTLHPQALFCKAHTQSPELLRRVHGRYVLPEARPRAVENGCRPSMQAQRRLDQDKEPARTRLSWCQFDCIANRRRIDIPACIGARPFLQRPEQPVPQSRAQGFQRTARLRSIGGHSVQRHGTADVFADSTCRHAAAIAAKHPQRLPRVCAVVQSFGFPASTPTVPVVTDGRDHIRQIPAKAVNAAVQHDLLVLARLVAPRPFTQEFPFTHALDAVLHLPSLPCVRDDRTAGSSRENGGYRQHAAIFAARRVAQDSTAGSVWRARHRRP